MVVVKTHKVKSTLKGIAIAFGVMLFLAIAGGIAYVYFGDRDTPAKTPKAAISEERPDAKPLELDPNAPVNASVQYILSPTKAGENTTMSVKTNPKATCTIVAEYNKVPSKDSGLRQKTADIHGAVEWTWTVDAAAAPGKWPIKVTCKSSTSAKSGYVEGTLEVTK